MRPSSAMRWGPCWPPRWPPARPAVPGATTGRASHRSRRPQPGRRGWCGEGDGSCELGTAGHARRTIPRLADLYHRPMTLGADAASLLRAVGLLADGPVRWGRPVPATGPGVFVVELPAPLSTAPIELTRVGKWIERVEPLR